MLSVLLSQIGTNLTLTSALIMVLTAAILGLLISGVYVLTHKKTGYQPSFAIVLVLIPTIISLIIMLVGSNVARAFSLAGAFSLIRYRSTPGEPKDLTFILFTMGIGLGCGIGYVGYAVIFTLLISVIIIALDKMEFGKQTESSMQLKIVVPEDMNYFGSFDEIFAKYTVFNRLVKVKTGGYGTMFELVYQIRVKNDLDQKQFIDEIRMKNGNLNVYLNLQPSAVAEW